MTVSLPENIWRAVELVLIDFIRFGPGEFDSEHIPDEHLEKALRAITKAISTK